MDPLVVGDPAQVGPYRLVGRLGAGELGTVYQGRTVDGRLFAVRLVHERLAYSTEFRDRFREQVQAARRVGGAFLVPVAYADPEAAVPWLASGYLDAPGLDRLVAERGPLAGPALRGLTAGLVQGLASIHGAGVFHHDLKPSNVLMTPEGPRLIDFGLARVPDAPADGRPGGGAISSTGYLAPERQRGGAASAAADVFGLGAVLCFAATGSAPFGPTDAAVPVQAAPHRLPNLAAVADPALRRLIADCLAEDPAARPTTAELSRRLTEAPVPTPAPVPAPAPAPASGPAPAPAQGPGGTATAPTVPAAPPAPQQTLPLQKSPLPSPPVPPVAPVPVPAPAPIPAAPVAAGPNAPTQPAAYAYPPTQLAMQAPTPQAAQPAVPGPPMPMPPVPPPPTQQPPAYPAPQPPSYPGPGGPTGRTGVKPGVLVAGGAASIVVLLVCFIIAVSMLTDSSSPSASGGGTPTPTITTDPPTTDPPTDPPTTDPPTYSPVPAPFDPTTLDSSTTDLTPQTSSALLPYTFTDDSGGHYTLKGSGPQSCISRDQSAKVKDILTQYSCVSAMTGAYVNDAGTILVSVKVLALADAATATKVHNAMKATYTADMGIECPLTGVGASVCNSSQGVTNAVKRGWESSTHRYYIDTVAIYINLSQSSSAGNALSAPSHKAVDVCGPLNYSGNQ